MAFVLESEAMAQRRGKRPYGEVAGFGASSDAFNMVIPSPDPGPAVAAMRRALADAGVDPAGVDYVNAHATSTPVGDVSEARALLRQKLEPHMAEQDTLEQRKDLAHAAVRQLQKLTTPLNDALKSLYARTQVDSATDEFSDRLAARML